MSVTIRYREVYEQVFTEMMTGRQPFLISHVEEGDIRVGDALNVLELSDNGNGRTGRELTADVVVVRDVRSALVAGFKLRTSRPGDSLSRRALSSFGVKAQLDKTVEECAELILAIRHHAIGRAGYEKIAEEVADVENMLVQLRMIVGDEMVDGFKNFKLNRFEKVLTMREASNG